MKKRYKNKRDFYKAEAERNAESLQFWREEAEKKQKLINELKAPKKEEMVNCAWFCPTCRTFAAGTKGKNYDLEGSKCLNCGKPGIMTVSGYPSYIR